MKKIITLLMLLLVLPIAFAAHQAYTRDTTEGGCGGYTPSSSYAGDIGRSSEEYQTNYNRQEVEERKLAAVVTDVKVYKQTSISEAILKVLAEKINKILNF